jgi:hypothetical protein
LYSQYVWARLPDAVAIFRRQARQPHARVFDKQSGQLAYDFATEKQRCLSMLDRFLAKRLDEPWPRAANFAMTGKHWSQLQFKHLNHHLKQFGL